MTKLKNILILAGGDGSRFWPLKRKSYFPFLGKPLLLYLIENIDQYAEKIIVVVNSADVQLIDTLNLNSKITAVEQNSSSAGQAGAIISAKNKLKGEVLVLNAEDLFNFEILRQYIDILKSSRPEIILLAKKVDKYFSGGYFNLEKNRVKEIIEKPKPEQTPSNLVRLVVDYFKDFSLLVNAIVKTKTNRDDQYEQAINALIYKTGPADYITYTDFWYPLKYSWQVLPMLSYFLKSLNKDEIRLGKNVKIAATAKFVGPCFIDDDTVIGDFTLIRQSQIGKNCLIGGHSEVTRSYLGDNVYLHRNYVGDSVLAENIMFGAQAATANFRFDAKSIASKLAGKKIDSNLVKFGAVVGEGSKIGVNATLLPGVKIGKNTFVGPGEIIYEDIKDNIFVLQGKQTKNLV